MNDPTVPDDKRNWESIDIFLFSNGQQYSPPRKYHLRTDELQWWDATIHFLGRCHYGTVQSMIELYSLDGRKIEGPLELKNEVAYVAVIPPDAFIPAGYEKYLIKASRSREKRQEQLLNSTAIVKSGENEVGNENKLDMVPEGKDMENRVKEKINENTEAQRYDKTSVPYKNKGDKVHKENSCEINKGKVFKNNIYPNKACKNKILMKKRNSPLVNKIERNHKKNHSTYSNNISLPLGDINRNKKQCRQKLPTTEKIDLEKITKISENPKDSEPEISRNQDTRTHNTELCNKELKSNIRTNIEDNGFDKGSNNNSGKIDFSYNNEIPDQESEVSPNPIKEMTQYTNAIEKQIQSTFTNKDRQININLNVMLKNYSNDSKSEHLLMRCKSNITLPSDKASQVNAEVSFNKEIICFEGNPVQINGISENNIKAKENVFKLDTTKVIVVHCKCDNIDTKNMFSEQNKEKSNIIFVLPTTNETTLKGDKHNHEIQTANNVTDKAEEKHSKHPDEGKRKIPEVKPNKQDIIQISEDSLLEPKYLVENSTQMDWCNILLQTRFHEDGRYTFHLPSLGLLKQYNMNTL